MTKIFKPGKAENSLIYHNYQKSCYSLSHTKQEIERMICELEQQKKHFVKNYRDYLKFLLNKKKELRIRSEFNMRDQAAIEQLMVDIDYLEGRLLLLNPSARIEQMEILLEHLYDELKKVYNTQHNDI